MLKFGSLVCLLLTAFSVSAQQNYLTKIFGPVQNNNTGIAVRQISDGSIFFAGNTDSVPGNKNDFSLVKMDSSTNITWNKVFGTQKDEFCNYMLITKKNDKIVMAGTTFADINNQSGLIIITDTSGNFLKQETIGKENTNTRIRFIQETMDGGFIICGSRSAAAETENDFYVAKLDANLEIIWEKTYGGIENDYAQMVRQTADSGFIVSGDSKSFNFDNRYENYIIKLDNEGEIEWETIIDGKFTIGNQSIFVTSGNEYLITGEAIIDSTFRFDFVIAKITSQGKLKWKKFIGGPGTDAAFSAVETDSGKFLITGYSNSYDPQKPIKIIIMEIDSAGNEIARNYFGPDVINLAYDIQRSVKNGFLAAGSSGNQFILIKSNKTSITNLVQPPPVKTRNSFLLFPNPSSRDNTIKLNIKNYKTGILKLTDLSGRELFKTVLIPGQVTFQLPVHLSPGTYLIQFSSAGENITSKLLLTE